MLGRAGIRIIEVRASRIVTALWQTEGHTQIVGGLLAITSTSAILATCAAHVWDLNMIILFHKRCQEYTSNKNFRKFSISDKIP